MRTFIAAAILGLSSLPRVIAWGAAGHEIVAIIAQSHLEPQVLKSVCSILGSDGDTDGAVPGAAAAAANGDAPCYLSAVATWADKIRFHARWSAPLHFINGANDHPPNDCRFPGADGWAGKEHANVLDAIHNVSSILTDFVSGSLVEELSPLPPSSSSAAGAPELAQEALKFLIHFMGDMHQPLHLCGRDRGGNSDKVEWDGRQTNLHSVWDNSLIAKAIRLTPAKYTKPIAAPTLESSLRGAIYDPYIRLIVWEGIGVGKGKARWSAEAESWLSCPAAAPFQEYVELLEPQPPQEVLVPATAPRKKKPVPGNGPPSTSDSDTLCPYAWGAPIHALNCGVVWPPALDNPEFATHENDDDASSSVAGKYLELDTPEYTGKIEKDWVVEKLLAQAGVRLAGVLNAIFAPQEYCSSW